MLRVHVLVDLGNTDLFRGLERPNPPLVADRLDRVLDRVATVMQPEAVDVLELRVRLYHGWFAHDGRPTNMHNLVRMHVMGGAYPTRRRKRRVFVDLAEWPLALPGAGRVIHTLRESPGLPPTKYVWCNDVPTGCAEPRDCAVHALRTWLRGRCALQSTTCSVGLASVVAYRRQKLVDTALVSDLIWLATSGEDVAVLSDDEDVVPGLLTASTFPVRLFWLCRSGEARPEYSRVIDMARIGCIAC
jgi:hypothetical protein